MSIKLNRGEFPEYAHFTRDNQVTTKHTTTASAMREVSDTLTQGADDIIATLDEYAHTAIDNIFSSLPVDEPDSLIAFLFKFTLLAEGDDIRDFYKLVPPRILDIASALLASALIRARQKKVDKDASDFLRDAQSTEAPPCDS